MTGLAQLRVCVCTRTVRATSQLCRGAALLLQYVYDCVYMSILVCVYMTIYVTKYVYAICSCLIILLYVCSTYSGNTYINLSHIHLPVISYLTHLPRRNWWTVPRWCSCGTLWRAVYRDVCVYVCVCMCVCMYVCMCMCICTCICLSVYIICILSTYVHVICILNIYLWVHICCIFVVHVHLCVYVCSFYKHLSGIYAPCIYWYTE